MVSNTHSPVENKSDPKAGFTAVPIGKREGENEDVQQVSAKKHKSGEVAEEQRNEYKIVPDNSFSQGDDDEFVSDNSFSDSEPDMPDNSSDNSEEGIEEAASKTPQDPKMLSTLNERYAGSKTICAKNLSYSVERADLEDLFKECGEIVDIRLHMDREGRFRGFGHVEFATAEAAQKALKLNYTELLRCRMRIGLAPQKHKHTSNESFSFNVSDLIQRNERTQPMKGSEISQDCEQETESAENDEEEIEEAASKTPQEDPKMLSTLNGRYAGSKTICAKNLSYSVERPDLENLFKECGEIVDIRLHTDREGRFRGFGHVEFATAEAAQKALKLNYTELLRCRMRIGLAPQKHKYTSNESLHINDSDLIQWNERTQPMKGSEISLDCEQETEPKMPATLEEQNATSKTIYATNLSYGVKQTDMEDLFKEYGEIVAILLPTDDKGLFKGHGHVKFATAEAAQKAVELNHTVHFGCRIGVGIAQEKGEYISNESNWSNESDQPSPTVYVRGFDTSLPKEKIKASLENHFGSCGEIARISIPKFRDSGVVKGFAHLDFNDDVGLKKALLLDQTELGGFPLIVEKAKPRRENQGIGSGRCGGGHDFGGRDGSGYISDKSTGRKN